MKSKPKAEVLYDVTDINLNIDDILIGEDRPHGLASFLLTLADDLRRCDTASVILTLEETVKHIWYRTRAASLSLDLYLHELRGELTDSYTAEGLLEAVIRDETTSDVK